MNQKVTVIGAGRMGSALAAALYKRGFDTTVWNRTYFVKGGIFVPARSTRRTKRAGSGRQSTGTTAGNRVRASRQSAGAIKQRNSR